MHDLYQYEVINSLKELLRPPGPLTDSMQPADSICVLAALLVLASHARPRRLINLPSFILWDPRCFELGLDRWLNCHSSSPNDSAMILFHMGFIMLHTNMAGIHNLVRQYAVRKSNSFTLTAEMRQWQKSDDCEIATLHATQILDIGARVSMSSRRSHSSKWTTECDDSSLLHDTDSHEAPHTAICVYLAVVTKWAATVSSEQAKSDTVNSVLKYGGSILKYHALGLAVGLAKVLRQLEDDVT